VREFACPLCVATPVGLPLALWLGQRHLDGYQDRVAALPGLALPLLAAAPLTLLVTTAAAWRHTRLALRPIEAVG